MLQRIPTRPLRSAEEPLIPCMQQRQNHPSTCDQADTQVEVSDTEGE